MSVCEFIVIWCCLSLAITTVIWSALRIIRRHGADWWRGNIMAEDIGSNDYNSMALRYSPE
jgi:hypothetical protein